MKPTEIQALARMLDRMDYYRLLRVERGTTTPQIHAAYRHMRRSFHPDAFLAAEEALRRAVQDISKRLNEGYLTLRDPQRRAAYDRGLDSGQVRYTVETEETRKSESEATRGQTPNGRRFYSMAEAAERKGDFSEAVTNLKMALTFEPQNEHFKARLEELRVHAPEPAKKKTKANPYAIR